MKRVKNLIVVLVLTTAIALSTVIAYFSFSGEQRRYLFRQEKVFYLDDVTMNGDSVAAFLDAEQSKIVLDTDGNATFYIVPEKLILNLANVALAVIIGNGELDLTSMGLDSFFDAYVNYGLFPGFTFTDVVGSLELLKSIGISIEGIDWDEEPFSTLVRSIEEDMVVPSGLVLPENLYLKLDGKYYIADEGEYTAVYFQLNDVSKDGEPFFIMTYSKDDDGERLFAQVELAKVAIYTKTK